jgi:hypothetical protein
MKIVVLAWGSLVWDRFRKRSFAAGVHPLTARSARKASVPVDDRRLGAIALRHFAGIGLDLAPAVATPYHQPYPGRRGIGRPR